VKTEAGEFEASLGYTELGPAHSRSAISSLPAQGVLKPIHPVSASAEVKRDVKKVRSQGGW
jgi:hypothetical protein